MKVLIVDDEELARARLATLLAQCTDPPAEIVGQAFNGDEALAALQRASADVALVDIHMPGLDGLGLAQALRGLPCPPAIVFVTAHAQHALQAFEIEAVDYLTKPVRLERLCQALRKVERHMTYALEPQADLAPKVLLVRERGRTERVPLAEVLYFRAELKYVTVRTAQRSYLVEESLNEFEQLCGAAFVRIHRSALVSRRAVRALERHHDAGDTESWVLRLSGVDDTLIVSRRQLGVVREAIAAGGLGSNAR